MAYDISQKAIRLTMARIVLNNSDITHIILKTLGNTL